MGENAYYINPQSFEDIAEKMCLSINEQTKILKKTQTDIFSLTSALLEIEKYLLDIANIRNTWD